jgi:hypothetical protein
VVAQKVERWREARLTFAGKIVGATYDLGTKTCGKSIDGHFEWSQRCAIVGGLWGPACFPQSDQVAIAFLPSVPKVRDSRVQPWRPMYRLQISS